MKSMKGILAVVFFAFAAFAAAGTLLDEDAAEWSAFLAKHPRVYGSASEAARRFEIFRENLRAAEQLRQSAPGAEWGWTAFSDLTPAEFSASHGLLRGKKPSRDELRPFEAAKKNAAAAAETDWVARGLVSSVKDQRQCGSCWAFATAGGAEGCYAAKFNKTIDLSPQQIIDCSGENLGCHGGFPNHALHWCTKHDVALFSSYPYLEKKSTCRHESQFVVGLPAGTCEYFKVSMHEEAIREALVHAPVPILIAAAPLQSYRSGVINGSACKHLLVDHAVLVVADTKGVYTVKNSWGAYWGEKGFFRMAQGENCLLMTTDPSVAY